MIDLDLLSTIPIFRLFTRPELEASWKLFKEAWFEKDDVVVRIGDPGDSIFVVLDGELEAWDGSDPPRQTGSLKRGDYFGEMALLQGGGRTATVTVARRARLLSIDKPAFERLFLHNPKAIEHFARVLSTRLAGVTRGERIHRATTVVSIAGRAGLKGETLISRSLAAVLKEITGTNVVCVEVLAGPDTPDNDVLDLLSDGIEAAPRRFMKARTEGGPMVLRTAIPDGLGPEPYGILFSNLVAALSDSFAFVVLDLGSGSLGAMASAHSYSDFLVVLLDKADDETGVEDPGSMKVMRAINLINSTSRPLPVSSSEPFVIPHGSTFEGPDDAAEFIRANPRAAIALPIQRLAHKVLGTSVGLALGGGAAFGLAHLGVLKVLEDAGVPIDLLAGCSQGSIIAVGYATGLTPAEMISIARELGTRRNFLATADPTFFTLPGILLGQRIVTMMRPYLKGKETFNHLLLPCRTVATDIETGERVALASGRLETAYRASSAVPMVMTPVRVGGRVLVDGGVSDPVPAEVTRDMGADITVAVNVVPRLKRGVETVMSSWYRKLSAFNPVSYLADAEEMPNIFDIVMNSMQTLQHELGNFKAISADVLINPDLSDFTWVEYYRADELIDRGAEAAKRSLPAIEKEIADKIAEIRRAAGAARGGV